MTVTPEPSRALKVSVRFSSDDGIAVTSASFATETDESFHGFGGRRNATDQRGEDFVNWLEEFHQRPDEFEWVSDLPTMDERYQFPTGAQGAYYVQSLFISSRPYGFWLERDEISRWRMASDRDDAWQVGVAAPGLDLSPDHPDGRPGATRHGQVTASGQATRCGAVVFRSAAGPAARSVLSGGAVLVFHNYVEAPPEQGTLRV